MLRMIFTVASTLALLLAGSVWLAAQPSGGELREVVVPVLRRGVAMAASASRRVATAAGSELRRAAEDETARVPLTPTESGVWEPDPLAPPAAQEPPAQPDSEPELDSEPEPAPEPVEEVVLAAAAPFIDSPEPEAVGPSPRARPEADAGPPPDQDDWAALIRRMLVVHGRVSGAR